MNDDEARTYVRTYVALYRMGSGSILTYGTTQQQVSLQCCRLVAADPNCCRLLVSH